MNFWRHYKKEERRKKKEERRKKKKEKEKEKEKEKRKRKRKKKEEEEKRKKNSLFVNLTLGLTSRTCWNSGVPNRHECVQVVWLLGFRTPGRISVFPR